MDLHAHRSVGRGTGINRAAFFIGLALVIIAVSIAGCSTVTPHSVRAEWEHTSHPFAGPPFGPKNDEDSLNTVNAIARWNSGRLFSEIGVGYKVGDSGFVGPDVTFTSRIGVELWSKDASR